MQSGGDVDEVISLVWEGDDHEWWHPHNGDYFRQVAEDMLKAGNSIEFTAEVLGTVYGLVADEFGC